MAACLSSHFPPARKVSDGEAFAWVDRYLDGAHTGPVHLRNEAIATLVIESLFRGESLGHYRLGPFVIMANHVHLLLLPSVSPSLLLKSLKGATAREANRLLHRTGEQFWQRESYDHWVRDDAEWNRIARVHREESGEGWVGFQSSRIIRGRALIPDGTRAFTRV